MSFPPPDEQFMRDGAGASGVGAVRPGLQLQRLRHYGPVALDRALTTREAAEFSDYLRPLVESGTGQERTAFAYLTAVKD